MQCTIVFRESRGNRNPPEVMLQKKYPQLRYALEGFLSFREAGVRFSKAPILFGSIPGTIIRTISKFLSMKLAIKLTMSFLKDILKEQLCRLSRSYSFFLQIAFRG